MLKVLWLTSWYPSVQSPQNGDFIQRHARAVAAFAKVHVLHVVGVSKCLYSSQLEFSSSKNGKLVEEVVMYPNSASSIFFKVYSFLQFMFLFKKYIKSYINANGLPDVVHVHVSMRAGILALWMKRKYKTPYLITEHWGIFMSERTPNFISKNYFFKLFTKVVFKKSSLVLPVSKALGNSLQKLVAPMSCINVLNVVDIAYFYYVPKVKQSETFRFVHVSSLSEIKNPRGIIRAFAQLLKQNIKVHLTLIGTECKILIEYAKNLEIPSDNISFKGQISYDKVANEMQNADVFVLFSHSENLPCVIAESLCCGVPVIATNVGGISEMVDTSNGVLVQAGNETALMESMKEIINNYARYNRVEIAETAQRKFNYDAIAQQIILAYKRVLQTH